MIRLEARRSRGGARIIPGGRAVNESREDRRTSGRSPTAHGQGHSRFYSGGRTGTLSSEDQSCFLGPLPACQLGTEGFQNFGLPGARKRCDQPALVRAALRLLFLPGPQSHTRGTAEIICLGKPLPRPCDCDLPWRCCSRRPLESFNLKSFSPSGQAQVIRCLTFFRPTLLGAQTLLVASLSGGQDYMEGMAYERGAVPAWHPQDRPLWEAFPHKGKILGGARVLKTPRDRFFPRSAWASRQQHMTSPASRTASQLQRAGVIMALGTSQVSLQVHAWHLIPGRHDTPLQVQRRTTLAYRFLLRSSTTGRGIDHCTQKGE